MNHSVVAFLVFYTCFAAFSNAQFSAWQSGSSDGSYKDLRNAAAGVLDDASDFVHGSERVRMEPAAIAACVAGGLGLLLLIACCACCYCCCRRSAAPQTIVMTPPPYAQMQP